MTSTPSAGRRMQACAVAAAIVLSGCQGEHQQAGRKADEAAAAASGSPIVGAGPQERLGAARDNVERASRRAQMAEAKALEKRAGLTRSAAEAEAEQMEQRAKAIRESLKQP